MSDIPLSGKVGLDVTEFKAGIQEINREIRVIESGFRASAAALGDWGKSADGLEMRIKALSSEMDLQRRKVESLQGMYSKVASEKGEASRAAQDLQVKLNKETETLNKMGVELASAERSLDGMGKEADQAGNEVKELGDKSGDAGKKLDTLKSIAAGLGGAMKIGAAAIAGTAAAAAAAGVAIAGLVKSSSDYAGELVDTANKTGIGIERLQELAYIGGQVGVSTDTITGSLSKLTRAIGSAADGTGSQADAFKKLGVYIRNSDGSLKDSKRVWEESLTALGKVANETERDTIAMELFGKSAMELNPLIKTSSSEMAKMAEEGRKLGAVMSEKDVNSLEAFGDTLAGLQAGLKGTMGTLATAFLPAFQGIASQAQTYLGQFSEIVRGSGGDLGKMAGGIGELLGRMATDIAQQAPKLMEAGLGIIKGIVTAIVTALPILLPAAVSIIASLVKFIIQNLPLILDAGFNVIVELVKSLLSQLPMLIDAALKMVITLATGIAEALPELIPAIVAIIPQIILILLENLPLLIDAALKIILALVEGIITALPILIEAIPQIVEALATALILAFPLLLVAVVELMLMLAAGIVQNIPVLLESTLKLNDAVARAIRNADWNKVGADIVEGIKAGFQRLWQSFVKIVEDNVRSLIETTKALLGINSPSKVFAGMGENMALGLGAGFGQAFRDIQKDITTTVGGLSGMALPLGSMAFAGAAPGAAAAPISVTVYATVNNDIDRHKWAWEIATEIQRLRR